MLLWLDDAVLSSCGTVLDEAGAGLVPVWVFELEVSGVLDGVVAGAAVAGVVEFWSLVVDGAVVGFAWLGVWFVTAGDVELWLASGVVLDGVVLEGDAELWLEVAEELL